MRHEDCTQRLQDIFHGLQLCLQNARKQNRDKNTWMGMSIDQRKKRRKRKPKKRIVVRYIDGTVKRKKICSPNEISKITQIMDNNKSIDDANVRLRDITSHSENKRRPEKKTIQSTTEQL
jgi:hypothetical protein